MEVEKRFKELKLFIADHLDLLNLEVLEHYPVIPKPYESWVDEINHFTSRELIELENGQINDLDLAQEFKTFLFKCRELSTLPKANLSSHPIPKHHLRKMTEKKRHEISLLMDQLKFDKKIFDLGSGAGHLSGVLLEGNQKQSLCVDQDPALQEIGKKKLEHLKSRLKFKALKFNRDTSALTSTDYTLLGLHSCGELSLDMMRYGVRHHHKKIVSYGCCYHKLNCLNFSGAQDLELSNHALTMAAKSYKKMTEKEFIQRESVKRYRYTLHFIMRDHLGLSFRTLGNGMKADYKGKFAEYCHKFVSETKRLSASELEQMYLTYRNEYERFLRFGIIRSCLSRPLEVYLNLDRCLYLIKNGFKIEVQEVFDRSLSPRNISIVEHLEES